MFCSMKESGFTVSARKSWCLMSREMHSIPVMLLEGSLITWLPSIKCLYLDCSIRKKQKLKPTWRRIYSSVALSQVRFVMKNRENTSSVLGLGSKTGIKPPRSIDFFRSSFYLISRFVEFWKFIILSFLPSYLFIKFNSLGDCKRSLNDFSESKKKRLILEVSVLPINITQGFRVSVVGGECGVVCFISG